MLDGGVNINVTRETLDGEKIYMKLYKYEDSEIVDLYTNDKVKYNSDGSINISYGQQSTTKIKFNVPSGDYILTLKCLSNEMPSTYYLKCSFYKVGGTTETINLKEIYNQTGSAQLSYKKKVVYLKLHVDDNSEISYITLEMVNSSPVNVSIDKLFKYTQPVLTTDIYGNETKMTNGQFDAIVSKMFNLDTNNDYVYTYVVNKDEEIKNPLEANSFLNDYHIMNKYTICQMSSNSNIEVTNKIK